MTLDPGFEINGWIYVKPHPCPILMDSAMRGRSMKIPKFRFEDPTLLSG